EGTPSPEGLPPESLARRLDRVERRLFRERRNWRIALLAILAAIAAALFLIAIAIFSVACHLRRARAVDNVPYYWFSGPPPPPWYFRERGPWAWGPQGSWPAPRPWSGPGAPPGPLPPRMPSQPSPTPGR